MQSIPVRLLAASLCLFACCAAAAQTATQLPTPVRKVMAKHGVPAGGISAFVREIGKREPLLAVNADQPRQPASVIKTMTTFVALDVLGPAYTWKTEAYVTGKIIDGRLDGDLIIKGYGDPYLVTENLWKFMSSLRSRGLRDIGGNLIIDNSHFEQEARDPNAFDQQPGRSYNVLPQAFLVNFQTVRFQFLPNAFTGEVTVIADPHPANLKIDNRLKMTQTSCKGRHYRVGMQLLKAGSRATARFSGNYPFSCGEHELYRVILKPAAYTFGVFKALWTESGGKLTGGLVETPKPEGARLFYHMKSPPLTDLIRGMNKFSNNVMTRHLLLTLGAERYGAPGTLQKGRNAVTEWLQKNGLTFNELILDNGAGLSRKSRISARSLASFLSRARASNYMPHFISSLPLSAVDGTLRRRYRNGPLAGRVYAKTGTLKGVKTLGGYLYSRSGKQYVLTLLQNYAGSNKAAGQAVQDAMLQWIYDR